MSILTVGHEIPVGQPVTGPVLEVGEENEKVDVESTEEATGLAGRGVELEHIPLPDLHYDRSVTSLHLPAESQHDHSHLTVDASLTVTQSNLSFQSSICPDKHRLLIDKGWDRLNRDEHRFAATFNYSRFIRHRVLVDDVLRALYKFTYEGGKVGLEKIIWSRKLSD